jgi:hypothetical protein
VHEYGACEFTTYTSAFAYDNDYEYEDRPCGTEYG